VVPPAIKIDLFCKSEFIGTVHFPTHTAAVKRATGACAACYVFNWINGFGLFFLSTVPQHYYDDAWDQI